jgi:hypothetical protein
MISRQTATCDKQSSSKDRRRCKLHNNRFLQQTARKVQVSDNTSWGLTGQPNQLETYLCGCPSQGIDNNRSKSVPNIVQHSIDDATLHSLSCKLAYQTPIHNPSEDNYTVLNHKWKMVMANAEVILNETGIGSTLDTFHKISILYTSLQGKNSWLVVGRETQHKRNFSSLQLLSVWQINMVREGLREATRILKRAIQDLKDKREKNQLFNEGWKIRYTTEILNILYDILSGSLHELEDKK